MCLTLDSAREEAGVAIDVARLLGDGAAAAAAVDGAVLGRRTHDVVLLAQAAAVHGAQNDLEQSRVDNTRQKRAEQRKAEAHSGEVADDSEHDRPGQVLILVVGAANTVQARAVEQAVGRRTSS